MTKQSKDLKYKKEILATLIVAGVARSIPQLALLGLAASVIANLVVITKKRVAP